MMYIWQSRLATTCNFLFFGETRWKIALRCITPGWWARMQFRFIANHKLSWLSIKVKVLWKLSDTIRIIFLAILGLALVQHEICGTKQGKWYILWQRYCGRKAGRCQSKVDEERKRNFPCTLVKPPLQCNFSQNLSEISLALTSSNALLIHLNISLSLSLIDRSVAGETLKCYSTNDSVAQQQWTQCDDRKGFRTCFTKYNMSE